MASTQTTTPTRSPTSPSTETGKYSCSQCSSSFKRPEHLKRHQRSHEQTKRFLCTFCSKRFARSDILARHSAIHTDPARLAEPLLALASESGPKKRRRACTECARAREKCTRVAQTIRDGTGRYCCLRCSVRGLYCVYPEQKRAKQTVRPGSWPEDRVEDSSTNTSPAGLSPISQATSYDGRPTPAAFDEWPHPVVVASSAPQTALPGIPQRFTNRLPRHQHDLGAYFPPPPTAAPQGFPLALHHGQQPCAVQVQGAASEMKLGFVPTSDYAIHWLSSDTAFEHGYDSFLASHVFTEPHTYSH